VSSDDFEGTEPVTIQVGPFLLKCEVRAFGVHILTTSWLRSDDLTYESRHVYPKREAAALLEDFLWSQFGDEIDKKAIAVARKQRENAR